MGERIMEHKYLECECHSAEHIMRFSYLSDEKDVLYVEIHLGSSGFWRRVCDAIKHIFGYNCKFGCFDEFVWTKEQVEQLRNMCDEWLKGK
jgi:hypothetical protein